MQTQLVYISEIRPGDHMEGRKVDTVARNADGRIVIVLDDRTALPPMRGDHKYRIKR